MPPPSLDRRFYDWLTSPARTADDVSGAKYFLFGLGNSRAYAERYQKASKDVEKRLEELGCQLELPRGEVHKCYSDMFSHGGYDFPPRVSH
jgi:flavodoxin